MTDDPDRMDYEWKVPAFVQKELAAIEDGTAERRKIRREDIDLGVDFAHAYMLHNVFSAEECAAIIEACQEKGFTPALVNVGRGVQQYIPDYRKGLRCIADCKELAKVFHHRIAPWTNPLDDWEEVGVNERMRVLCYSEPGDVFQPHCDGMFRRPNSDEQSLVTLQLYLNTIPDAANNGGGTRIILQNGKDYIVQPVTGSVVAFTQGNVEHEGMELFTGGIKYTVRTELMYSDMD